MPSTGWHSGARRATSFLPPAPCGGENKEPNEAHTERRDKGGASSSPRSANRKGFPRLARSERGPGAGGLGGNISPRPEPFTVPIGTSSQQLRGWVLTTVSLRQKLGTRVTGRGQVGPGMLCHTRCHLPWDGLGRGMSPRCIWEGPFLSLWTISTLSRGQADTRGLLLNDVMVPDAAEH